MTDAEISLIFDRVASLHAIPVNGEHLVFSTLVGVAEGEELVRAVEEFHGIKGTP